MPPNLRLLWDFYGPSAEATATHHQKHMVEFLLKHSLSGSPELERDEGRVSVFLDLPSAVAEQVGRALRPRRVVEAPSN